MSIEPIGDAPTTGETFQTSHTAAEAYTESLLEELEATLRTEGPLDLNKLSQILNQILGIQSLLHLDQAQITKIFATLLRNKENEHHTKRLEYFNTKAKLFLIALTVSAHAIQIFALVSPGGLGKVADVCDRLKPWNKAAPLQPNPAAINIVNAQAAPQMILQQNPAGAVVRNLDKLSETIAQSAASASKAFEALKEIAAGDEGKHQTEHSALVEHIKNLLLNVIDPQATQQGQKKDEFLQKGQEGDKQLHEAISALIR